VNQKSSRILKEYNHQWTSGGFNVLMAHHTEIFYGWIVWNKWKEVQAYLAGRKSHKWRKSTPCILRKSNSSYMHISSWQQNNKRNLSLDEGEAEVKCKINPRLGN
jgi:hypothetical protein